MSYRGKGSSWLVLCLLVTSCTCGGGEVQGRSPALVSDLPRDLGGESDFVIEFGAVALGRAATRTFRLRNEGSAILSLELAGIRAPFSLDLGPGRSSTPLAIPVGGEIDLRFVFRPLEEGTNVEQLLTLSSNEEGRELRRIRLEGRGLLPRLSCDPGELDFHAVARGTTRSIPAVCRNLLETEIEVAGSSLRGSHAAFFSSPGFSPATSPIRVGPGKEITIEVELRAESLGANQASLDLRDPASQILATLPISAEVVTSALQLEPSGCLDFSYVALGKSARRSFSLRNVGAGPLTLARVHVPAQSASDFSAIGAIPLRLEQNGDTGTVEVEFHPTTGGPHEVLIELITDEGDAGETRAVACARGFGGGPSLSCDREMVDFGPVAVGVPASTTFRCANTGSQPPGIPIDRLHVRGVSLHGGGFSASILHHDASAAPKRGGYAIGESFLVEVIYQPEDESFDQGVVRIESLVNDVEIPLAGQGRILPPCELSITPPALRFGVVPVGQERVLRFELRNELETSCLIRDLRLSDASDSAYSLDPLDPLELEGHAAIRLPVRFAPPHEGRSFSAEVELQISAPDDPSKRIPLSGASEAACLLIEPAALDFGSMVPGCRILERKVVISNTCSTPITIGSIEIADAPDASSFHVLRQPGLPLTLPPFRWTEAVVAFDPMGLGPKESALVVELLEGSSAQDHAYLTSLLGLGTLETLQLDDFSQESRPMIDILWVIDNSGSMNPYQERLRENLLAFLGFAHQQRADFQIGVTTTALREGGSCPGGANGGENGRLFPVDRSHPRILTEETPELETHWKHNMMVGTCFMPSEESALEAAKRALSLPLLSEENAGFLRPNASLSIILVSDALDYSPDTPAAYTDFFLRLKRGDRDRFKVHAITGPRSGEGAGGSCIAQPGDRMIDVVEATGGSWLNLCTPTSDHAAWSESLRSMSEGVFSFAKRLILRTWPGDTNQDGRIDERDIEIIVDGTTREPIHPVNRNRVWTYDSEANAIDFQPLFVPKTGAEIRAKYQLSCTGG